MWRGSSRCLTRLSSEDQTTDVLYVSSLQTFRVRRQTDTTEWTNEGPDSDVLTFHSLIRVRDPPQVKSKSKFKGYVLLICVLKDDEEGNNI